MKKVPPSKRVRKELKEILEEGGVREGSFLSQFCLKGYMDQAQFFSSKLMEGVLLRVFIDTCLVNVYKKKILMSERYLFKIKNSFLT